jgi:MFS family permease
MISINKAFNKAGGFGFAQIIALFCLSVVRNSGIAFVYMFGILTMEQQYECIKEGQSDYSQCLSSEICANDFDYRIDKTYEYYLENWFTQMDWLCQPKNKLALLGTVYFIACFFGGIILAPVPDLIGRKASFILFGLIHAIAQLTALYSVDYYVRFAAMGTMGFFYARNSVCFNWMFELTGTGNQNMVNAAINTWDAGTGLIICGFYLTIERNWLPIYAMYTYLGIAGLLVQSLLLPESPKWLLINGKKSAAIAAFNWISRLNCSKESFSEEEEFEIEVQTVERGEEKYPYKVYMLLQGIVISLQFSYFIMAISIAHLAGNKFVNGIIFGSADILGAILSGYLQKFTSDIRLL